MPIFQPRNRTQILREMVARLVARSELTKVERNSTIYHVLSASAEEDANSYFEMARLRSLFALDKATGSDLDERAAEMVPNTITRLGAQAATTSLTLSRPGTSGAIAIPVDTVFAASDADGDIEYRVTVASTLPDTASSVSGVAVVASEAGARANVSAGQITRFVTRLAGITTVTNPSAVGNGRDRESDERFRARIKGFVQAISRATNTALENFAVGVVLADGQRVLFAKTQEPIIPDGTVALYIDDGTGDVETFDSSFLTTPDEILASAVGGETRLNTAEFPIRDDGSFVLRVNGLTLVRGTDYQLDPTRGRIGLTIGLTATDQVEADYRYYTGLIQEAQRVISGDPSNTTAYPGVQASGIQVGVRSPSRILQTLDANIVTAADFDFTTVATEVSEALLDYVNNLNMGDDVIVAELCSRAMDVAGVTNFTISNLSGSSPAVDQVILDNQVARLLSGSVTLA